MVQDVRRNEPIYSCVVSIEHLTGNVEEEAIALASTPEAARQQVERLLIEQYNFTPEQVQAAMQQARVENLAPWCAAP